MKKVFKISQKFLLAGLACLGLSAEAQNFQFEDMVAPMTQVQGFSSGNTGTVYTNFFAQTTNISAKGFTQVSQQIQSTNALNGLITTIYQTLWAPNWVTNNAWASDVINWVNNDGSLSVPTFYCDITLPGNVYGYATNGVLSSLTNGPIVPTWTPGLTNTVTFYLQQGLGQVSNDRYPGAIPLSPVNQGTSGQWVFSVTLPGSSLTNALTQLYNGHYVFTTNPPPAFVQGAGTFHIAYVVDSAGTNFQINRAGLMGFKPIAGAQ